jgi:hypothetical protein
MPRGTRKRKGLEDYLNRRRGQYSSFARAVDPRIRTECVACPPDSHRKAGSAPGSFTWHEANKVVGEGGAAGPAGRGAAQHEAAVILLERDGAPGQKVLISGNTR